jgi:uncharacterized protein (UPF0303 family)
VAGSNGRIPLDDRRHGDHDPRRRGASERRTSVVRRFGHSSYYMNVSEGGAFNANHLLDESEFAAHGGEFPVIVRGVGVVGTVTVSGLPQEEDHRLVVSVLRAFLG